jgi:hypothetical protein
MDILDRLHDLLGEAELELLKSRHADGLAKIDDAALANTRGFGQFGHRELHNLRRFQKDKVSDGLGTGPKALIATADPRNDVLDRGLIGHTGAVSCLLVDRIIQGSSPHLQLGLSRKKPFQTYR